MPGCLLSMSARAKSLNGKWKMGVSNEKGPEVYSSSPLNFSAMLAANVMLADYESCSEQRLFCTTLVRWRSNHQKSHRELGIHLDQCRWK